MRFFTSDLHFSHKNVIEFCNRPWATVEEMNAGLVDNWNSVVLPYDEVFILGDVFFCGITMVKEIMPKLHGKKYLIAGNHDWGKLKPGRAKELGFEWVVDQFCVRIGRKDVILNHFPYTGDHMDQERFLERRPRNEGNWLLHGHVHCAWKIKDRQINVGVDVWDYKPVAEQRILEIIESEL